MNKRIAKKIIDQYFAPIRVYAYQVSWLDRVRKAYILLGKRPPVMTWRVMAPAKERRRMKLSYTSSQYNAAKRKIFR